MDAVVFGLTLDPQLGCGRRERQSHGSHPVSAKPGRCSPCGDLVGNSGPARDRGVAPLDDWCQASVTRVRSRSVSSTSWGTALSSAAATSTPCCRRTPARNVQWSVSISAWEWSPKGSSGPTTVRAVSSISSIEVRRPASVGLQRRSGREGRICPEAEREFPSDLSQFCLTASRATRPRRTLARISSAVAVQTKGFGSLLCASR